jgi:citrate synthase
MPWLTAAEALQMLGVRPQTLYANVSRKKIRAKPDPKDTRRSLYHDADVRKMARQRGGQRRATAVAAAAIEWGDPILSSAISTAVDGRLYYRGQDAVVLSEDKTLEEVARILWGGRRLGDGDPRDDGERNNGTVVTTGARDDAFAFTNVRPRAMTRSHPLFSEPFWRSGCGLPRTCRPTDARCRSSSPRPRQC